MFIDHRRPRICLLFLQQDSGHDESGLKAAVKNIDC